MDNGSFFYASEKLCLFIFLLCKWLILHYSSLLSRIAELLFQTAEPAQLTNILFRIIIISDNRKVQKQIVKPKMSKIIMRRKRTCYR